MFSYLDTWVNDGNKRINDVTPIQRNDIDVFIRTDPNDFQIAEAKVAQLPSTFFFTLCLLLLQKSSAQDSSQWNLGKKRTMCPLSTAVFVSMFISFLKSLSWYRRQRSHFTVDFEPSGSTSR
jgi:hypothetical protein